MRDFINILNEQNANGSAIELLRKVLAAWESPHYGEPENQLENMSQVMDEVRAALGIEDMTEKSLAYRRGRNDAYHGKAYDPPLGRTDKPEYEAGWAQGRKERGL